MTGSDRSAVVPSLEAAATGLWLATWQVALAATLLRTAGATTQSFFALTAAWLLGGVLGARFLPRGLLGTAVLVGALAKLLSAALPFSRLAALAPLLAGAVAGCYAGAFIGTRVGRWRHAARFLLLENSGFVLGYALAFALLLWRAPWLDGAALGLGLALLATQARRLELAAVALAGLCTAYYLLAPYVGDRGWDGLMTATVLAHPDWVTTREVLYFAHPLLTPLTAPFFWLGLDPLSAAAARESVCAGGVVALSYLAATALARSRGAGVLAAVLLTLAVGRFRLATCGEAEQTALVVGLAFLFLYLAHRELWQLTVPGWPPRSRLARRALLAALLALALAVHLANAALALVVLGDALLSRPATARRSAVREAAWILGGAALLAGPFFLWLAIGPGGARSAGQVLRYFLEYHLSGEFLSLPGLSPSALAQRALLVMTSARQWLVESKAITPPLTGVQGLLTVGVLVALLYPVLRSGPPAARRLLAFVLLHLAHAFCFDSANPASLAPAMTGLIILCAASLGGRRPRPGSWLGAVAAAGVVVYVGQAHVRTVLSTRAGAEAARAVAAKARPAPAPLVDLCQLLDASLPADAVLLVSDRLAASYFHIYTRRRPLVADHLYGSAVTPRQRFARTSLSQRVYRPPLDKAAVRAAMAAGRPVYLLAAEPQPGLTARALLWDELRLYTLSPNTDR